MQVQTTVDETDIGKVSTGQEATFTVDAYPEENFNGTISQIRLAPQSIQNVVNYIVIVDVNINKLKLMPGMTANVKILIASASNVKSFQSGIKISAAKRSYRYNEFRANAKRFFRHCNESRRTIQQSRLEG